MNNRFFAHPLMALRLIKPFLFVLIIPLIKGTVQYLKYGEISGVLFWEAVLLGIIVTLALIRCRFFSVKLGKNTLTVSKGLIFHTDSHITRDKISSLYISRDILDLIFGSATCHINTEAGRKGNPDFIFKLSLTDAEILSKRLFGGEKKIDIVFSPLKIALLAAATSSSFTGLLIGVPVIGRIGKLLGLALEQMLLDEINNAANRISVYIPPVFGVITIIFLIAYGFAVAISFIKNINFKLSSDRYRIEVRSGFIIKKKTVFNKNGVNNVCIERNPLMRLFRVASMYASIGGYGNKRGERAVIVPCGRKLAVKRRLSHFFPHLTDNGGGIKPKHNLKTMMRFIFVPRLIIIITIVVAVSSVVILEYFDRLILFLSFAVVITAVYYAEVCLIDYKNCRLSFGDTVCAEGRRGFTVRELYCEKERVGVIRISQTPADRRYSTCKVRVTVRGESGDRIKVRNLDLSAVNREISDIFGI